MVLIKKIISKLEKLAPKEYAETYDNVGMIIGSYCDNVKNILITIDITEKILLEAKEKQCNLVISFHPMLFHSIKNIDYKYEYNKLIVFAIKNNINIYVIHTNFDSTWNCTNLYLSKIFGMKNGKVLIPRQGIFKKLVTYVPVKYANLVRNSLFKVGAGNIDNYSHCSYNYEGTGSYIGNDKSNPFIGKKGILHQEKEICINVIFPYYKLYEIQETLRKYHPYEEVAYEIYNIENTYNIGIGLVGDLSEQLNGVDLLNLLKNKMQINFIRHSYIKNKIIKRLSIITGSGRIGIDYAIKENADVFISSDIKYHDFFKSGKNMSIVDIGHYESEKFKKKLIKFFLDKYFTTIFIYESKIDTNPIKYSYLV